MLPKMQIDEGGIKHIISGSDVMCPGLTSKGGKMDDVAANTIVALMAEGRQNAMGIGYTVMSTEEIRKTNQGVAIKTIHVLGDCLWDLKELKKK